MTSEKGKWKRIASVLFSFREGERGEKREREKVKKKGLIRRETLRGNT